MSLLRDDALMDPELPTRDLGAYVEFAKLHWPAAGVGDGYAGGGAAGATGHGGLGLLAAELAESGPGRPPLTRRLRHPAQPPTAPPPQPAPTLHAPALL